MSRNLSMLADLYEFTMSNGYLESGVGDRIAYYDYFFRSIPDDGGYGIFCRFEYPHRIY